MFYIVILVCTQHMWRKKIHIPAIYSKNHSSTAHRKILVGEKIGESWAIRQNFPCQMPIFTDTQKMDMTYALTVTYLPNFSLPIAFTCMVHQNFPPPNIFHVRYKLSYVGCDNTWPLWLMTPQTINIIHKLFQHHLHVDLAMETLYRGHLYVYMCIPIYQHYKLISKSHIHLSYIRISTKTSKYIDK